MCGAAGLPQSCMSEVENSAALEEAVQDVHILKKVRLEKLDELKVKHENPYEITKYPVDAHNAELKAAFEKEEARMIAEAAGDEEKLNALLEAQKEKIVHIAGRIMSWRDMGKANFIDVRDGSDRIQVYVRMNEIGKEAFADFKKWDIGDIVGVRGRGVPHPAGARCPSVHTIHHAAEQVPAAPAGEVPRPDRSRRSATASGMWI